MWEVYGASVVGISVGFSLGEKGGFRVLYCQGVCKGRCLIWVGKRLGGLLCFSCWQGVDGCLVIGCLLPCRRNRWMAIVFFVESVLFSWRLEKR